MKFALLLSLFSLAAFAHQDKILELDTNGKILGLPKRYEPASFVVSEKFVELAIDKKRLRFPSCLEKLVREAQTKEIQLTGSWYHGSFSGLPPYLNIRLPRKTFPKTGTIDGYDLLFNLTNLDLIQIEELIPVDGGKGTQFKTIVSKAICSAKELRQLKPKDY